MDKKELMAELDTLKKDLEAAVTEKAKKEIAEQIKALEAKIPDLKSVEDGIAEIKSAMAEKAKADEKNQELLDQIAIKMKDKNFGNETKNDFAAAVAEKKADIQAVVKGKKDEVELKADTLRSSIATNNHYAYATDIGQLGVKKRALYDIFPKIPLGSGNHNGTYAYTDWDEASIARAADMVAEGAAFPESTAAFKGYTIALRKVGDTLPVSDEFGTDEVSAAAELSLFIMTNVETKVDYQIVNGDNTGQNLKGLLASIDAYTPAASGITDANIYDLITKVEESIVVDRGTKYSVNFAAMNKKTLNTLVLKKDANNQYLFPPGHPIYSMIVEDNNIADNVMVVGDSRFGKIIEMGGMTISEGTPGTQFTEDMKTIKVRRRLAFLIRAADKSGFAKVTDVSAALATLAS